MITSARKWRCLICHAWAGDDQETCTKCGHRLTAIKRIDRTRDAPVQGA